MHRNAAFTPDAPLVINNQSIKDDLYMFISRIIKMHDRKISSYIKQIIKNFFFHGRTPLIGCAAIIAVCKFFSSASVTNLSTCKGAV